MQAAPSGWHCGGPQTPPLHWPLQQSEASMHATPSGWHTPPPQTPPLQRPVQQSEG
jgi:hypothetical protein